MIFSNDFLKAIPKTDLHFHIDGSLRLSTLIELAKEQRISLPSNTEEGMEELVFKKKYDDLPDYLRGFDYICAVMQNAEALERVSYELAIDCAAENVCYIEPRFAPQKHRTRTLTTEKILKAVDKGLNSAKKDINKREDIKKGVFPPFEYGIIGCAMRMFTAEFSDYYRTLVGIHPTMPERERFGMAALDLIRELIEARDQHGIHVIGFDIAGAEAGYPAEYFREAFDVAHRHFLKKTVHAGEAYGPASIFQALTECHAERIGHGTHLFDENMVDLPNKEERKRYVESLWQYIADSRITIEVCLTSNQQTMPKLKDLSKHPFGEMLKKKLSTTICTDNRLISRTTVTNELELATSNFDISPDQLKNIIIYGFKRSFYPGPYPEKRAYVRKVIDCYDRIKEKSHVACSM
ncbi:MAG: adenosine deaminase family protein [Pseudomonadota bacterium]